MKHFTYSIGNLLDISHMVRPWSFLLFDIGKMWNCFPLLQPKLLWLLSSQVIYPKVLLGILFARKLCLDDVFWRCKKCWSCTQYVQPASTIVAAHSQFLEASEVVNTELNWEAELLSRDLLFGWYTELKTVEWHFSLVQPAHLDCLRPPAEPPDSSEGCETVHSYARLILRRVTGISHDISTTEFVFNCYSLVVRNAYSSDSTVCNAITNLEYLSLKFASTAEYSFYVIIHSKWWVLLVTMQTVMGGTDNMASSLKGGRLIAENWLSAIPWVQLQLPSSLEANVWSVQQIFRTPVQDFDTCPVLKLLPS